MPCGGSVVSLGSDCLTTECPLDHLIKCLLAAVLPPIVTLKDQASHCFNVVFLGVESLESRIVGRPAHTDDVGVHSVLKSIVAHLADVAVDFTSEVGHRDSLWLMTIVSPRRAAWGAI